MKRYSQEEKAKWVEEWKGSGITAWTYAKENGFNPQTFNQWTKKEDEKHKFVEITGQIKKEAPNRAEILIEKGNIKIHVPLTAGMDGLKAVIQTLENEV
jgi:transposase-like protein